MKQHLMEQAHGILVCKDVTNNELNDKLPSKDFQVLQQGLDSLEKVSGGTLSPLTRKFENCLKPL